MPQTPSAIPRWRGIGNADEDLCVPLWVQVRVARLGRHFIGKIVINVYEGGVSNIQFQPRGGDAVTIHPKH